MIQVQQSRRTGVPMLAVERQRAAGVRAGFLLGLAGWLLLSLGQPALGEDALELDPIKRAQAALDRAHTDWADLLAPKTFAEAKSAFDAGQRYADKGDVVRARNEFERSQTVLTAATQSSERFKAAFPNLIAAIKSAIDPKASAPVVARQAWDRASLKLNDCAARFERGDMDGARTRAIDAENLMLAAGLEAVTTATFGNARALIAQAESAKVASYAPNTIARAKQLVVQGAQAIVLDRANLAVPMALAKQAEYEARHAMALAAAIRPLLDSKDIEIAVEKLIVDWEAQLQPLAEQLKLSTPYGVALPFDGGYLRAVETLRNAVKPMQEAIANADERVAAVEAKLDEAEKLRQDLQAKLRVCIESCPRLPPPTPPPPGPKDLEDACGTDCSVTSQDGDVVLTLRSVRMNGRVIEGSLALVVQALNLRPDAPIIINVFVDSEGSAEANVKLAQEQANALSENLRRISAMPPERILTYGSSGPSQIRFVLQGAAPANKQ